MKRPISKPIIAIVATSGADKTQPYVETILAHGGDARVLRPGDDFEGLSPHGIVLTGGADLSHRYYDHPLTPSERRTLGRIEKGREQYESKLLAWAVARDVPTLGICRGCQMMNVFAHGTLIPDIPIWQKTHFTKSSRKDSTKTQKSPPHSPPCQGGAGGGPPSEFKKSEKQILKIHKVKPKISFERLRAMSKSKIQNHRPEGDASSPAHDIIIEQSSQFYKMLGLPPELTKGGAKKRIAVNSSHHQALGRCGHSLIVVARAPDGIVEAIEDPGKIFWIGVQFHPERMWKRFPVFSNLFRRLIQQAKRMSMGQRSK